jgi:hypothetical protein
MVLTFFFCALARLRALARCLFLAAAFSSLPGPTLAPTTAKTAPIPARTTPRREASCSIVRMSQSNRSLSTLSSNQRQPGPHDHGGRTGCGLSMVEPHPVRMGKIP